MALCVSIRSTGAPPWVDGDAMKSIAAVWSSVTTLAHHEYRAGCRARDPGGVRPEQHQIQCTSAPHAHHDEVDVMRGAFEVVLPGGCVVRVPAHFEAAALRRLLATLGAPC